MCLQISNMYFGKFLFIINGNSLLNKLIFISIFIRKNCKNFNIRMSFWNYKRKMSLIFCNFYIFRSQKIMIPILKKYTSCSICCKCDKFNIFSRIIRILLCKNFWRTYRKWSFILNKKTFFNILIIWQNRNLSIYRNYLQNILTRFKIFCINNNL